MPNILLIDDEEHIRTLYSMRLEKVAGFKVDTASDGKEALSKISQSKPDTIILDIIMPEMSGSDVLEAIKSDKKYNKIPVLMLTGTTDLHRITECLQKGAAGYIEKGERHDDIIKKNILIRLSKRS